jgi:hypothetical protein
MCRPSISLIIARPGNRARRDSFIETINPAEKELKPKKEALAFLSHPIHAALQQLTPTHDSLFFVLMLYGGRWPADGRRRRRRRRRKKVTESSRKVHTDCCAQQKGDMRR